MSFILDALKKSEAKRRAQAGPEWGVSVVAESPEKGFMAKNGRWLIVGFAMVTVVAIASAVLLGRGMQVSSQANPNPTDFSTVELNHNTSPAGPDGEEHNAQTATPSEALGANASLTLQGPSTELESEVQEVQMASAADQRIGLNGPGNDNNSVGSPSVIADETNGGVEVQNVNQSSSDLMPAADLEEAIINANLPTPANPPAMADTTWQPVAADYLYQWELPLPVRQALPALNLTIHVFAAQPEDRFVLINGVRYKEGAELGSGAVLAEIRAEGALVDFRDYRFLLTR